MTLISLQLARRKRHRQLEDLARQAFISKDFTAALEAASAAVRYQPDCAQGQILLGDVLCIHRREAEALRAYHQARRVASDQAEPYWSISTIHVLAGNWERALGYLDQARERLRRGDGPLYQWIAEDRALVLRRLGRLDEALESVRWGLRRRPHDRRLLELRDDLRPRGRPGLRPIPGLKGLRVR